MANKKISEFPNKASLTGTELFLLENSNGTYSNFLASDLPIGSGTVTSVSASISGALSVAGSPITASGTLAFSWTGSSSQQILGDGSLATKITNNNQLTNGSGYLTSATIPLPSTRIPFGNISGFLGYSNNFTYSEIGGSNSRFDINSVGGSSNFYLEANSSGGNGLVTAYFFGNTGTDGGTISWSDIAQQFIFTNTLGGGFNIDTNGVANYAFDVSTSFGLESMVSKRWVEAKGYITTISGITAGGELAGTYANPTLLNSAVIGKVLTGYVSGAGTVASTDTILQAIQKLNGNITAIGSPVTSVSGTSNRITSSGGATPTIDISASYVGQASITTLGTITTGVWNGTAIANANLANSSTTINGTSIALGASGTVTAAAGTLTGTTLNSTVVTSSLTSVGTLTSGATGAGFTIALGTSTVTGTLAVNRGGTGFASYTVGDLLYADTTTTLAKLTAVAAGSYLRSAGTGTAPVWSTLTLPNTATTNNILYATGTNAIGSSANLAFDGTFFAVGGTLSTTAKLFVTRGTESSSFFEGVKTGFTDKTSLGAYADSNGALASFGCNYYMSDPGLDLRYNTSHSAWTTIMDNRASVNKWSVYHVTSAGTASFKMRLDSSGGLELPAAGSSLNFSAGGNIITDTTTGIKIATATSQKLAFWNATPVIQPTTGGAASAFAGNTSGTLNDTATWDSYTIGQVVKALRNIGILA